MRIVKTTLTAAVLTLVAATLSSCKTTTSGPSVSLEVAGTPPNSKLICTDGEGQFVIKPSDGAVPGHLANPATEAPIPLICAPGGGVQDSATGGKLAWTCTGSHPDTDAIVANAVIKGNGQKVAVVYAAGINDVPEEFRFELNCVEAAAKWTCSDEENQMVIEGAKTSVIKDLGQLTTPAALGILKFNCVPGTAATRWTCDAAMTSLGTLRGVVTGNKIDLQKKNDAGAYESLQAMDCR